MVEFRSNLRSRRKADEGAWEVGLSMVGTAPFGRLMDVACCSAIEAPSGSGTLDVYSLDNLLLRLLWLWRF